MDYLNEVDQKTRRKIITIAISTVALILALIVAIIVVATNKPSEIANNAEVTDFSVVEEKAEQTKDNEGSTVQPANDQITTENNVLSEVNTMPETGPADILPFVLLCGSFTTFLTSSYLAKKSA